MKYINCFQDSLSKLKMRLSKWITTSLILIAAAQAVHNSNMACIAHSQDERFEYQCNLIDLYESLKSKKEEDEQLKIWEI